MDCWIFTLLVLMGVHDGALPIRNAPHLGTSTPIHCHILWGDHSHDLLFYWGAYDTAFNDIYLHSPQLHSTILTLLAAIVQLVALVWYLVSYFPMGSQGLRFAARVGAGRAAAWMNN